MAGGSTRKIEKKVDTSTTLLEAARKMLHQKGYAASWRRRCGCPSRSHRDEFHRG
jgi:hypothetical protein